MKGIDSRRLIILALLAAINIVGATLALLLRLPIYLDCLGTIMAAMAFGPVYGMVCALISGLINGMIDSFALFFMPVAILIGGLVGYLHQKQLFVGKKLFLGTLIVAGASSMVAAIIVVWLFGGLTSSGSTYLIQALQAMGMNLTASAFVVQFLTDYLDKFIAITVVLLVLKRIPTSVFTRSFHE